MFNTEMIVSLIAAALLGAAISYFLLNRSIKPIPSTLPPSPSNVSLALQAYERLLLLADRIALPNLINRLPNEGISASEMRILLVKHIREEFDYNVTQQMYVSAETWKALKNFRDKNLLIVNQISMQLPQEATALDLQKAILTFLVTDQNANLHDLVSEALSYEAKKLM
ncbi:MAG: hypothetical protein ACRC0I_05850 [Sediminibacterium sp.]